MPFRSGAPTPSNRWRRAQEPRRKSVRLQRYLRWRRRAGPRRLRLPSGLRFSMRLLASPDQQTASGRKPRGEDHVSRVRSMIVAIVIVAVEVEGGEEVAERRAILGNVGIVEVSLRVRQVVAAAIGDLWQIPIALDEFDDRGMIGIFMRNASAARILRDQEHRNAGAIAEII